jgi:hypothetical protein
MEFRAGPVGLGAAVHGCRKEQLQFVQVGRARHDSGFAVVLVIHGHRTLKAPHPVRSAQLSKVPLS